MTTQRLLSATHGTGAVTTVAGVAGFYGYTGDRGLATAAKLNTPLGVAYDTAGNIYISDSLNDVIRVVNVDTNIITTVAGTTVGSSGDGGLATAAKLSGPRGVAIDAAGNIYIADAGNGVIRVVTKSTGIITTVAGTVGYFGYTGDGGPATAAKLGNPSDVAIDTAGNIYIADPDNYVIRKVTKSTGIITTVAGTGSSRGNPGNGGLATLATFLIPSGVAIDVRGNINIADYGNNNIRLITSSTGIITTLATGVNAYRIAFDIREHVYIACPYDSIIQLIALSAQTSTPTLSPTATPTLSPSFKPTSAPTLSPASTSTPTSSPTSAPTLSPASTSTPTSAPTATPTLSPASTSTPTLSPTSAPTLSPASTSTPTYVSTYTHVCTSPTATPIFASTKINAAAPKTNPNLLAYLLISTFICFMGQVLFYSSW